jgi:hypothetical protein
MVFLLDDMNKTITVRNEIVEIDVSGVERKQRAVLLVEMKRSFIRLQSARSGLTRFGLIIDWTICGLKHSEYIKAQEVKKIPYEDMENSKQVGAK